MEVIIKEGTDIKVDVVGVNKDISIENCIKVSIVSNCLKLDRVVNGKEKVILIPLENIWSCVIN